MCIIILLLAIIAFGLGLVFWVLGIIVAIGAVAVLSITNDDKRRH